MGAHVSYVFQIEELDYPYDVRWLDIEHTDGKDTISVRGINTWIIYVEQYEWTKRLQWAGGFYAKGSDKSKYVWALQMTRKEVKRQ